jgi:hypothetical protein
MNTLIFTLCFLILVLAFLPSEASDIPRIITHQGVLTSSDGTPVEDGTYVFTLRIYDVETEGTALWAETQAVAVTGGIFSVRLGTEIPLAIEFDSPYWLGISVDGGDEFEPRIPFSSVPYALYAKSVETNYTDSYYWRLGGNNLTADGIIGTSSNQALDILVNNGRVLRLEPHETSPNILGGYSDNWVEAEVFGATVGGGGASNNPNRVIDNFGTVGGGLNNRAGGVGSTVGGGSNNTTGASSSTVSGGSQNTASVSGSTVGGGFGNTASEYSSTVGGGYENTASGFLATIGGGTANSASAASATVSGGNGNIASGSSTAVGGGNQNTASGAASAVGGGSQNSAGGTNSTVSGGLANMANGIYAAVPGGYANTAAGSYSFAGGRQAKANHTGAFVWGGGIAADVASPANNTFNVRASGGIWLGTTNTPSIPVGRFINTSTGAYLTTGGVWTNSSDRDAKENFAQVDSRNILEKVAGLPIKTWNYRSEAESVRHMGPVAQDFYAAFGLGQDETSITTIDADGVALAAIQGLYQVVQEQETLILELESALAAQQNQIDKLVQQGSVVESGSLVASDGLLPTPTIFSALACLLAGLVFLHSRKKVS